MRGKKHGKLYLKKMVPLEIILQGGRACLSRNSPATYYK